MLDVTEFTKIQQLIDISLKKLIFNITKKINKNNQKLLSKYNNNTISKVEKKALRCALTNTINEIKDRCNLLLIKEFNEAELDSLDSQHQLEFDFK
jgi:hypothetical protein